MFYCYLRDGIADMLKTLHCIALRTIKYNERNNILTAYSLEAGRVSLLTSAGAGREAVRRRAITMPMSVFQCVADMRPGRDIYNIREPQTYMALHGVYADPMKSAIAMFLAELLAAVLKESQEDKALFSFLTDAIARLENMHRGIANFHIAFLYRLGRYIGIEPDISTYMPGRTFDMREGIFRVSPPLHSHYLDSADASVLATLSRISWENAHAYAFSRTERQRVLQLMLDYYTLHYESLATLRSLDVLRALFD